MTEPRKTVIAGCLFIAYEGPHTDRILREHKMFYYERSLLTSATDHDALRIIAALDNFFVFRAPKARIVDGDEILYDFVMRKAQKCCAAVIEDGSINGIEFVADDPIQTLLAVYQTIENFCNCLPIPSQISAEATAHTKCLYEAVHLTGGFEADEQAVVVAGCFYVALRQPEVPRASREVWIVSGVPSEELEAVVKDLENLFGEDLGKYFAEEESVELNAREESRRLPYGQWLPLTRM